MTFEEIRELIRLANETGIVELEVQRGDDRVRLRRGVAAGAEMPAMAMAPLPLASAAAAAADPPPSPVPVVDHTPPRPAAPDANVVLVKSPITGTFYEAPSPGAAPFTQPGDRIQPGKVLCIIEAMKQMNEILAETAGVVESKLVLDGQVVEEGEALFAIRVV